MEVSKLIANNKIISDQISRQSLEVVLENLNKVLSYGIEGEVVEFGCYSGTTSLFIRRLLDINGQNKAFHVYDSFEGLPDKTDQDNSLIGMQFKKGELQSSKKELINNFKKAGINLPIIHKSWFSELDDKDLPEKIAFSFLDGDFYESILTSLKLTWPRLTSGGIICVDDYKRQALPGVEAALMEYFGPDKIITKKANIGVINK